MQASLESIVKRSYTITNLTEAKLIIGGGNITTGFSIASKMPCHTYSLPATFCKTGSVLRGIEGSTCSGCYACPSLNKGHKGISVGWYEKDRVQGPMNHRLLQVIFNPRWTDAMIYLFKHYKFPLFRWHDSGDIYDLAHFENICKIADAVSFTKFWLPTQEWNIVIDYWNAHGKIPLNVLHPNLIVRLSARMLDGAAPLWLAERLGVQTSRVSTKKEDVDCPASHYANSCGPCRKCWNQDVKCVTYHFHNGNDDVMHSEFVLKIKKIIDGLIEKGVKKYDIDKTISQQFSIQKINVRLIRASMLKDYKRKLKILD